MFTRSRRVLSAVLSLALLGYLIAGAWLGAAAKEGDKHRFAVCWNGLVYPLVSVGDKADLWKDVKTASENRKKERDRDEEAGRPQSEEEWSLWHGNLGNLEAALLLRLGEADLASELWAATHPDEKENEYYIGLAANWAWTQSDRALGAHMRGGDVLALHSFRRLSAFTEKLEAEAKNHGLKPDKGKEKSWTSRGRFPNCWPTRSAGRRAEHAKSFASVPAANRTRRNALLP